jgi:hypothetical protein
MGGDVWRRVFGDSLVLASQLEHVSDIRSDLQANRNLPSCALPCLPWLVFRDDSGSGRVARREGPGFTTIVDDEMNDSFSRIYAEISN